MRLLFDENLSPRLSSLLGDLFPGSESVVEAGLGGASDATVWAYASSHGLMIVSKDLDFVDRAVREEDGVRVVWLRLGNCSTQAAHLVVRNCVSRIEAFSESTDVVLEIP